MNPVVALMSATLASNPLLQGVAAALSTFVLEDPTTIGCGLLVADGRMAFWTALVGVSAGIALGDVGLYALGRALGPKMIGRWPLSRQRFDRAAGWFEKNVATAVVLSRLVPGMRLPTYVCAGVLRVSPGRFVAVVVVASLVWTTLLLRITIAVGHGVLPLLGRIRLPMAVVAVLLFALFQLRRSRRRDGDPEERVISKFEFWPPWFFYIPVLGYWIWLTLRHRSLLLPTAANPSIYSGGFIGESKTDILDLVPEDQQRWIAAYASMIRPERDAPLDQVLEVAREAMASRGLSYPVVAKPDVGQRGAGVRPVYDDEQLRSYLELFPPGSRLVLQELVAFERDIQDDEPKDRPVELGAAHEAGILYCRFPGAEEGRIFSITLKMTPSVVGDGTRSLRELIEADPRARRIRHIYFSRLQTQLDTIPAPGERQPLVFSGNHCQGAVFKDGSALSTDALYRRFHGIARAMPEFYFGRFDLCFSDTEALLRGEGFKIVEINGAGAEATHIWDASIGLGEAYSTLFEQFRILFSIGAANRNRGFRPIGLRSFFRDVLRYRRIARGYPSTS